MSVLSSEQQSELIARLEGSGEPEPQEPVVETAAAPEVEPEESAEPDAAPEIEDEGSSDDHHVPYSRFKSVIDTRNDLRYQVQQLEEQLLYIQQQGQAAPQQERQREQESHSIWDDIDDGTPVSPEDDRYSMLEQRLERLDEIAAENELEGELAAVSNSHPDVPHEVILEAIAGNPELTAHEVAESYSQFVAEIEEAALARYKQQNQGVAPRVGSMSSPAVAGAAPSRQPISMDTARDALVNFLQDKG